MFEMQHVCADGVTRTLGMALDGHSDRPVFVTRSGSQVTAKDWKKLGRGARRRMAADTGREVKPFDGDLVRMRDTPEAFDAEQLDLLRHYLRGRGLTDADVEEALACARRDLAGKEAKDALPVAGAAHAALPRGGNSVIKKTREPGEKIGIPAEDHAADFARLFPEVARVGHTFGTGQFDPPQGAPGRRLAGDGVDGEADYLLMFPMMRGRKTGEWTR